MLGKLFAFTTWRRELEMGKKIYVINGMNVTSVASFYDEITNLLILGAKWGRNLDAFNDILRGGFGTSSEGFVLRLTYNGRLRKALGPSYSKIIDIIKTHCVGGQEENDGVELKLIIG
jgi:RNAse (barnase) inhibitor barstar